MKNVAISLLCCFAFASLPATITPIATKQAPQAIGPYSQAIQAGLLLFVSGQIAMDPLTGNLIGKTIEEQTLQVLNNMEAILAASGLKLDQVVKTEVYMTDLKDFPAMNRIYGEKFSNAVKPARATVQVSKLPKDALVEISCIAIIE